MGEEAVAEINAFLPEDLRVFSCSKVTGGFRPRDAVSYRWARRHTGGQGARAL